MSFQAKYPGRCTACDERIHEGDWVRYEDDFIVLARVFGFHDAADLAQFIREQDEKRQPTPREATA